MKTLSLSRPLMILMAGLPGAGKTFFAKQFSEMFSAPFISMDRLRFELFADPQYSTAEQELLARLATYQMAELVKTNRSFIVDGFCDSRAERQLIDQFAKKRSYDTLVVWVQTDPAEAKRRSLKRNPKKSDDAHNYSLTPEQFQKMARRFTPPTRESHLVISGRHTFATQAKMVLRKLTMPHASQAQEAHKQQRVDRPVSIEPRPIPTRKNVVIN